MDIKSQMGGTCAPSFWSYDPGNDQPPPPPASSLFQFNFFFWKHFKIVMNIWILYYFILFLYYLILYNFICLISFLLYNSIQFYIIYSTQFYFLKYFSIITNRFIDRTKLSVFSRELKNIYCIRHNHREKYFVGDLPMTNTDGIRLSVYSKEFGKNYCLCHYGICQAGLFFSHAFSICKTIGFFLPIEITAKYQINDKRYANIFHQ